MPSPLTEAPQPGLADSAAELDPAILAAIERELKTSVSDVPPALVAHAVAVSKKCGNEAFCAKRFTDACKFYTQAIAGAPGDKNLRSNRSAAYLALGDYEAALSDAIRCVALDQNWPKAHYRLGKALAAMGEWHAAAATLERCARLITGVGLVPASKDTNTVSTAGTADTTGSTAGSSTDEPTGSTFNEPSTQTDSTIDTKTLEGVLELLAIAKCESEDARSRLGAHETGRRKDLASRLREARRADDREATLARWRQTMSGPEWDVDENEWRPTFPPNARAKKVDPSAFDFDNRRGGALAHARTLAELAAPKNALAGLDDTGRLAVYARGVKRMVLEKQSEVASKQTGKTEEGVEKQSESFGESEEKKYLLEGSLSEHQRPATPPVGTQPVVTLCISGGGPGVLPLIAAAAGSAAVFSVERGRFSFRATKGVVKFNETAGRVPKGVIKTLDRPVTTIDLAEDMENKKANCVVTDLLDRAGGLGMGVLRALDTCASRGLLTKDVAVVPKRLKTFAQLLQIRIENVAGFDLRQLNAYRWHPQTARFSPDREPHVVVSSRFEVFDLDLQARVRGKAVEAREREAKGDFQKKETEEGTENSGSKNSASPWDSDATLKIPITADGVWNAVVFWFECDMGGGDVLRSAPPPGVKGESGAQPDAGKQIFTGTSWGLAAQYLDETFVRCGDVVSLRCMRDDNQIYFQSTPPASIPRRAAIPMWHYDMLNDHGRNAAYDACIKNAVRKYKGVGNSNGNPGNIRHLSVIDAGSGSGLLAMMAARAGADSVTAIERSAHMTDAGEEIVCVNGFAGRIHCLHRDVRHVFTADTPGLPFNGAMRPDGVVTEMQHKAQMMVYEIFDSGLIGEGALHVLAYARERLLKENSILVPAKATVFAQLIEMRHGVVAVECGTGGGVDSETNKETNQETNQDANKDANEDTNKDTDNKDTKDSSTMCFDFSHCNRWRWRDEYEGINLEACKETWRPLSEVVPVFDFDFYDVTAQTLRPESKALKFPVHTDGTCNAVAFWFVMEVGVDEFGVTQTLSTSPHDGTKGQTWQQAVQYFEEFDVVGSGGDKSQSGGDDKSHGDYVPRGDDSAPQKSDSVPITASHDTYGIRFDIDDGLFPERATRRDPRRHAPSHDPVWGAALARAKQLDGAMNKILTQNPLEYRAVAETAVAVGARPQDLGFEAEQGGDFCLRLMG
mmetsp:Transcript_10017/g.37155  ORF Transcript_10017/g.37155 Transcript_10017/m.37155 type:complete len:1193 (+) Transcript_10017:197-3775(+)